MLRDAGATAVILCLRTQAEPPGEECDEAAKVAVAWAADELKQLTAFFYHFYRNCQWHGLRCD